MQTGLLAANDPAFPQLENYAQKHFAVLGLNGKMVAKEMQFHGIESIYTVTADDRVPPGAGSSAARSKAHAPPFYSVLACGCGSGNAGHDRKIFAQDRRYTPFFMNGSASGRILMIRKTLLMERDGELQLMAGAPRR